MFVYHDGKLSRSVEAKLIKCSGKRKLIEYLHWDDEVKTEWFVKRRKGKGGTYESIESNYWFYRKSL